MTEKRKNYKGLEVQDGFINRQLFGFRPLEVEQGAGCVYGMDYMHKAYVNGGLTEREMGAVDEHLLECKVCENSWDARTSREEDSMPTEESDSEED